MNTMHRSTLLTLGWCALGVLLLSLLTGCECVPETDASLCGDQHCGMTSLIDNCGDERQVDCQDCPDGLECSNNQCICANQSQAELCQEFADCGSHTVTNECGFEQQIDCGDCAGPNECVGRVCQCQPESESQLCSDHEFQCAQATVEDRCGEIRQIDCGSCVAPYECQDNHCDCDAESDAELCADNNVGCGETTATDLCGQERFLDCGDCSSPDECIDNQCQCIGEDEAQLCDAIDGACGSMTVTDICGDERTINCQDCAVGDSTFGAVRDADTGALLSGADIRVYNWPPPGGEHYSWMWPQNYRANDADYSTTTHAPGNGDANYEFSAGDAICVDDANGALAQHQWYRIIVNHPDYEPGVFYRFHGGYQAGECPSSCPADSSSRCFRQDFELWESGTAHPLRPNLFADPREMVDHVWQCALLPDDAAENELIGLRARLGGMNIGHGPFHLEGLPNDDVVQYIEWSDGSVETHVLDDAGFEYHDDHRHTHFMDWFRMSLVEPIEACRDVDDRSDSCVLHDGLKISYCLHDQDAMDGDVMNFYGGNSPLFLDPPVCDTTEQGITQGWRDTYSKRLPGQVVIVGTPLAASNLGSVWIEAEVDPNRTLIEVERDSNVSHVPTTPPDNICGDSSKVLDCSMPRDDYDTLDQRWQCGDYLDYVDY